MKKIKILFLLFIIIPSLIYGQKVKSTGTGFFVSENGFIITCAHVIDGGANIKVKINDKEYDAQVISQNNEIDIALLKIDYKNPQHFKVVNFSSASLGDRVFVLGFPLSDILGSEIRLTDGIVSARNGINSDQIYFQLSAPVQPGNSGGPIFNSNLEVIGVAAAKLNDMVTLISTGAIPQNINFGVKSEYVSQKIGSYMLGNGNIRNMNDAVKATVHIISYEAVEQTGSIINIVNRTGYTIYNVYVSPITSNNWEEDVMGSNVLRNGQSVNVRVPTTTGTRNRYDIRLKDSDGDTYTKNNVLITPNLTLEFTIRDLDLFTR